MDKNQTPIVKDEDVIDLPLVDPRVLPDPDPVMDPEPVIPPVEPALSAGDKTPPNLLLKSLQEERAKVKKLETELLSAKNKPVIQDAFSDEGKFLQSRIEQLESEILTSKANATLMDLQSKYPQLKERLDEFKTFMTDYPAGKEEVAAKIFLTENDLLTNTPPRKGLEKAVGGGRNSAPTAEWTPEKIDNLRTTNYRKYKQLLMSGAFE